MSSSPGVSAVGVGADPAGGWRLGIVGKRTWIVADGRCHLSPQQVPLVVEPIHDQERAVLLHDADVILNRSRVDIIIEGHVYPPGGRTPFDLDIRVGAATRRARAFGPRRVTLGPRNLLLFSDPAPVDRIPLAWESAYGGVDQAARADIGDPFEEALAEAGAPVDPRFGLFAYPRNPVGRGYVIEPSAAALEACQLPLLEDPGSLLTPENLVRGDFVRWPEGPAVAGFGWLSYGYFPRTVLLGAEPLVYDGMNIPPSRFFEVSQGDLHEAAVRPERPLAERLGVMAAAQSSAVGMRAAAVRPGDVIDLQGLHPKHPRWTFAIPSETPSMVAAFAGEGPVDLPPASIRTVFIQPDLDRLTLVWTAEMPVSPPPGPKRLSRLQHSVLWTGRG